MKKLWILIALAAVLGAARTAGADARNGMFVSTLNATDNLFGFHVWGTDGYPRGLSFDNDSSSNPIWSLGLERGNGDLFIDSYTSGLTMFRMRGDAGQLELGTGVNHPAGLVQLNVTAGTASAPRAAIAGNVYGDYAGLVLNQYKAGTARSSINFNNKFLLETDSGPNGGTWLADLFLWDIGNSKVPWQVTNADLVVMNYGATITGTATVNGAAALNQGATIAGILQHTGNQFGFYGATPITKPVIQGCRSDGTALKNLLTALQNMGLITDQTTP